MKSTMLIQTPYPRPLSKERALLAELSKLFETNVIRSSKYPFTSPPYPIYIKGTVIFDLSSITRPSISFYRQVFPLPKIIHIFKALKLSNIFQSRIKTGILPNHFGKKLNRISLFRYSELPVRMS